MRSEWYDIYHKTGRRRCSGRMRHYADFTRIFYLLRDHVKGHTVTGCQAWVSSLGLVAGAEIKLLEMSGD